MTRFVGRAFTDETVHLDGQEFIDCVFRNCALVFEGGVLPKISTSQMEGCKVEFLGAAARSFEFLRLCTFISGELRKNILDQLLVPRPKPKGN